MRRFSLVLATAMVALAVSAVTAADEAPSLRLFPGTAPGERGPIEPEKFQTTPTGGKTQLTNVSVPSLAIFPAPAEKANGTAVIIAPGGAYRFLSWEHEGEEIARWFSGQGVTAFVLKYRVPRRDFDPETKLPLMDAQRAVRLVRSRAEEWGLNPKRIGFLGFSAGGHLAANLSSNFTPAAYDRIDSADEVSARPDFAVLIYPGGFFAPPESRKLAPWIRPDAQNTPPSFVAVAADDKGSVDASLAYFTALKDAGVKSELHVYASGGHGFGMRPRAGVAATWPHRCADWLRGLGLLPAQQGAQE